MPQTTIVQAAGLGLYDPDRFDAVDNGDGTFTFVPLAWLDDASYAAYQGDPFGDQESGPLDDVADPAPFDLPALAAGDDGLPF